MQLIENPKEYEREAKDLKDRDTSNLYKVQSSMSTKSPKGGSSVSRALDVVA